MQYILAILFGILFLAIIIGKWMRRKQKEVEEKNDFMYSEKEHEYFKGENRPEVDHKGKLIHMDEHAEDIN